LLEIIKGYKSPDYDTMKLDDVKEEVGRWAVRNYCKNKIPLGLIKDPDLPNKEIDEKKTNIKQNKTKNI